MRLLQRLTFNNKKPSCR